MNKKYICIDEIVVVSDENGNLQQVNKTESIEEILKQENVIERLEKLIKIKNNNRTLLTFLNRFFAFFSIFILVCFVDIGRYIFKNPDLIVSSDKLSVFMMSLCGITLESVLSMSLLFQYSYRKKKKSRNDEITFLEKSLVLEKEKLQKLNLSKQIERESISTTINDKEKWNALKRKLYLYLLVKKELRKNSEEKASQLLNNELYTKEELDEIKEILSLEPERPKVLIR